MERLGDGERERDRFVEIVETEVEDCEERDRLRDPRGVSFSSWVRLRPRSSAFLANSSSAIPFLSRKSDVSFEAKTDTHFRRRSLGTSLVSCGTSLGFASCWVLEGLEAYGLSWVVALHS